MAWTAGHAMNSIAIIFPMASAVFVIFLLSRGSATLHLERCNAVNNTSEEVILVWVVPMLIHSIIEFELTSVRGHHILKLTWLSATFTLIHAFEIIRSLYLRSRVTLICILIWKVWLTVNHVVLSLFLLRYIRSAFDHGIVIVFNCARFVFWFKFGHETLEKTWLFGDLFIVILFNLWFAFLKVTLHGIFALEAKLGSLSLCIIFFNG